MFTLTSDVEESSIRSEDISLDYEFYHSDLLALECGNDYTVTVTPKDINVWVSRLFLGDADGFPFCTIRTWTHWSIGPMKQPTAGSCEALPSGPSDKKICAYGKRCQNKYNL